MIKIEQLQVGSMVEYNGMINDIVGIIPPKPDKSKRFNDVWAVELSIGIICPLADIKPIPLTEKILTEWCGFGKIERCSVSDALYNLGNIQLTETISKDILFHGIHYKYLHELQLLCAGLKTALPIQIN